MGVVRLDKMPEFMRLHRDQLLPMFHKHGIKPFLLLNTEVGTAGKFYDLYEYRDMADYDSKMKSFLEDVDTQAYYEAIQPCLVGTIETVILRAFDYSPLK